MGTNDLIKKICKLSKKKYGVRVTKAQAKAILDSLKDVTYDECKKGGYVKIRGFMCIKGILTRSVKLPNGTYNIPRLKMVVSLSEVMVEKFKKDVTGELDEEN